MTVYMVAAYMRNIVQHHGKQIPVLDPGFYSRAVCRPSLS